MVISVREIKYSDIGDLLEIFKSIRLDFPTGFLYNVSRFDKEFVWWVYGGGEDNPTFVAEIDGRVAAFVTHFPHWSIKNMYYIGLLATHRKFRGLGAGRSLIKRCMEVAVEKGFDLLSLHTWGSNRAVELYRKTGFCWVPSDEGVFMVNFSPQLMKIDLVKKFFGDAGKLIDYLAGPPEKIFINGHLAWKYRWVKDGDTLEAVFQNDGYGLIGLLVGGKKIFLELPENRVYLEGEEVSLGIDVSEESTLWIDDALKRLKRGKNLISIKAREKNELFVDGIKFSFKLRTVKKITIDLEDELVLSPRYLEVVFSNNGSERFVGKAKIVSIGSLEVSPREINLDIEAGGSRVEKIFLRGAGEAIIKIGDVEKKVHVLAEDKLVNIGERFESISWSVSKDSFTCKALEGFNIWYQFFVGRKGVKFEVKDGKFFYSDKKFLVYAEPRALGGLLEIRYKIIALDNIEDSTRIIFYIPRQNGRIEFIVPIGGGKIVLEKLAYPNFPKDFFLTKTRVAEGFMGYKLGEKAVLINIPKNAKISLGPMGTTQLIEIPTKIRSGESIEFKIFLQVVDISELEKGFKFVRALEISSSYGKLVVKNNWFDELDVYIRLRGREFKAKLKAGEVKEFGLEEKLCGIHEIEISYNGLTERREIFLGECRGEKLGDAIHKFGKLLIETIERGASLKRLEIGGENLLYWSEKPRKWPHPIPINHGGAPIEIYVDKKPLDLPTIDWKRVDGRAFKIIKGGLEIERRWIILSEKEIILETCVKNIENRLIEFEACEEIIFNKRIVKLSNESTNIIIPETGFITSKKFVKVELENGLSMEIKPLKGKQELDAIQRINDLGVVEIWWGEKIAPGQIKKKQTLIVIENY